MKEEYIFNFIIFISYIFLIVPFMGLSIIAPHYLNQFENYVKLYICISLLLRFNPLRNKSTFNSLDRKIAFSAGLLLLSTTMLNVYKLKLIFWIEENFISKN